MQNSTLVAKLYYSIIDDVIENVRELLLDEGLEDRVLEDLKQLWETKLVQSKVLENSWNNGIGSSEFMLQLPSNYSQTDPEVPASSATPSNVHSVPVLKSKPEMFAFSFPAGMRYPVQIPAGVTIQTESGQLYKVNIPVLFTATVGQQCVSQPTQVTEAATPAHLIPPKVEESPRTPASSVASPPPSQTGSPASPLSGVPPQPPAPAAESPPLRQVHSPEPEAEQNEDEQSVNEEPLDLSVTATPLCDLLEHGADATETPTLTELQNRDVDDILNEVIRAEREKADKLDYDDLSDLIIQLDGPAEASEKEKTAPLEENDFLGLLSAEAIEAIQEIDGSSDGNLSSSDDEPDLSLVKDEGEEDEDPLNSEDDVTEQDIPDLFDTDNVLVCQYDKIHRSKNRWRFHLKDGVMSFRGKDYVFSKALGEAEW